MAMRWYLWGGGLMVTVWLAGSASAAETRLGGIRLDAPSADVTDVYGQPEAVLTSADAQPGPEAANAPLAERVPAWALGVTVALEPGETEWLYRKGDVSVGFVLDPRSTVRAIAVSGGPHSVWRPHRYVRLGDGLRRVVYRYGFPDGVAPMAAVDLELLVALEPDCVLTYGQRGNIGFALHDGRVVRIHIWRRPG
jgi:hypothetical protein